MTWEVGALCGTRSTRLVALALCEFHVDFCGDDLGLPDPESFWGLFPFFASFSSCPSPTTGLCRVGPVGRGCAEVIQTLWLTLRLLFFLLLSLCLSLPACLSPPSITHPLLPPLLLNMGKFWGDFKSGRMLREMGYLKQAAVDLHTPILGLNICVSLPRAAHNCPNYNP